MDDAFARSLAERLMGLSGVEAVALGGSRAQGVARPDSDWDFAIYYRGDFKPASLRDLGWPGVVSELGEWGGGVFNGGAWLTVEGRSVDVHYRDLDVVEREIQRAERGEFDIEPLMFHLAGIPTYLLLAELAINRTLGGELPKPAYPAALSVRASALWADRALAHLDYARVNHARHGRLAQSLGLVSIAAAEAAHSIVARRRAWVTNDKRLLEEAGLSSVDDIIRGALGAAADLPTLVRDVETHIRQKIDSD